MGKKSRVIERSLVGTVLAMSVGVAVMAWRVAQQRQTPNQTTQETADSVTPASDDARVLVTSSGASFDVADDMRDHARIAHILDSRSAGTYFGEMLSARDSLNFRWPDRRAQPMRVWVQPSELDGFVADYPDLVREAFSAWQRAGVPIYFSFGLDSSRAEILVTWVDRFDERMTGRTRWAHDRNRWIVGGSIELALRQPDGTPLGHAAIRAIALHEVGHLIGLDHTASEANVMSARIRVTELSEADRATARLIYALPPGSLRGAVAGSSRNASADSPSAASRP